MTDGRVPRRTLPTVSFTTTQPLKEWLEGEAKRTERKVSHLLTELLEKARAEREQAEQKAEAA